MLDHAWSWAKETGHWRLNPIHGEEEVNIVLEDFFQHVDQQGSSFKQSGTFDLEDLHAVLVCKHGTVESSIFSTCSYSKTPYMLKAPHSFTKMKLGYVPGP